MDLNWRTPTAVETGVLIPGSTSMSGLSMAPNNENDKGRRMKAAQTTAAGRGKGSTPACLWHKLLAEIEKEFGARNER
jgi:hypothetical protein